MDLMTVDDVSFVLGVFLSPFVVTAVLTAVLATRSTRRERVVASVLSVVVVGSLAVYWWAWGPAFDAADAAGREPSPRIELTLDAAIWTSAVATTLLLALGAAVVIRSRRALRLVAGAR
jgi:biotin transporter BioY